MSRGHCRAREEGWDEVFGNTPKHFPVIPFSMCLACLVCPKEME